MSHWKVEVSVALSGSLTVTVTCELPAVVAVPVITPLAVDWYNQRVDACKDSELKAILAHNRDEEKEHAAMVLEWIRRKDQTFDKELKDFLFTDKTIAHE